MHYFATYIYRIKFASNQTMKKTRYNNLSVILLAVIFILQLALTSRSLTSTRFPNASTSKSSCMIVPLHSPMKQPQTTITTSTPCRKHINAKQRIEPSTANPPPRTLHKNNNQPIPPGTRIRSPPHGAFTPIVRRTSCTVIQKHHSTNQTTILNPQSTIYCIKLHNKNITHQRTDKAPQLQI